MMAAIKSPRFSIPTNLSSEESMQFIIDRANNINRTYPKLKLVTKNYIVQRLNRAEVLKYLDTIKIYKKS